MIICEKRTYSQELNTHSHHYGQLILPVEGHLELITHTSEMSVGTESLYFIQDGVDHTFRARDNNAFIIVDLPRSVTHRYKGLDDSAPLSLAVDDRWSSLRTLFYEESIKSSESRLLPLANYACMLLSESQTCRSIEWMSNHYHEDISLELLSSLEGYNVTYYVEWFSRKFGLTPMKFLQKVRIDAAKELLNYSSYPISMIAQLVGYEHQSSFTRAFKGLVGVTPNQFKRNMNIR